MAQGTITPAPGAAPQRAAQPPAGGWLSTQPGYQTLKSAGEMTRLALRAIRLIFTPPFPWVRDAVVEFSLALRRCTLPLVLSMITFGVGIAVLFVGRIVETLGTPDRLVGGLVLGFMREPAVWVTAMIFAGVAGSAMTADLGARRIREELDALEVLGLDTVKTLVVPRIVAMTLVAPVLGLITFVTVQIVDYTVIPLVYPSVSYAGELETMKNFLFTVDVLVLFVKLPLVGFFVGLVSCHKGLTTKGGAEGVGLAVNQAVVVMFLGLWILNGVVNSSYLAIFSSVNEIRG